MRKMRIRKRGCNYSTNPSQRRRRTPGERPLALLLLSLFCPDCPAFLCAIHRDFLLVLDEDMIVAQNIVGAHPHFDVLRAYRKLEALSLASGSKAPTGRCWQGFVAQ